MGKAYNWRITARGANSTHLQETFELVKLHKNIEPWNPKHHYISLENISRFAWRVLLKIVKQFRAKQFSKNLQLNLPNSGAFSLINKKQTEQIFYPLQTSSSIDKPNGHNNRNTKSHKSMLPVSNSSKPAAFTSISQLIMFISSMAPSARRQGGAAPKKLLRPMTSQRRLRSTAADRRANPFDQERVPRLFALTTWPGSCAKHIKHISSNDIYHLSLLESRRR